MEDNCPSGSAELNIPKPRFEIGTRVRWNSQSRDRGVIRGMRYVWSQDLQNWQYQYYVALDLSSPSREWTQFDWGWQEDLEIILAINSQAIDSSQQKKDDEQ